MREIMTNLKLNVLPGQACCEDRGIASRLTNEKARDIAGLLKALADPARLQILDILSQHGGMVCACDFEGLVGLPDQKTGERPKQPTISHHLHVLRKAGLIDGQKQGLWIYYFVHRERLTQAQQLLDTLLS